jgi:hypothetical protein
MRRRGSRTHDPDGPIGAGSSDPKVARRQPWNLLQDHEMADGMNATKSREGIEPPTRGFSARFRRFQGFINQSLAASCRPLPRHSKAQSWHTQSELVTPPSQLALVTRDAPRSLTLVKHLWFLGHNLPVFPNVIGVPCIRAIHPRLNRRITSARGTSWPPCLTRLAILLNASWGEASRM